MREVVMGPVPATALEGLVPEVNQFLL